jgi:death-on-curing protein
MPILLVLGGEEGAGRIDGILKLPRQTAAGRPAYPALFDKAAALFRSMILNHPFMDGNKRMGVATAVVFLDINGYVVCASNEELVQLAIDVAAGKQKSLSIIADWFRKRTLPSSTIESAELHATVLELVRQLPGDWELWQRPLMRASVLQAAKKFGA